MSQVSFVALCGQEHNQASYYQDGNYNFSRHVLSVQISLQELPLIIRHYPVLFRNGKFAHPVAILSFNGKENTFLDENGRWTPGHYIPESLQLHPFALHEIPDRDAGILLFDTSSSKISLNNSDQKRSRLFTDTREPTELLRSIAARHKQLLEGKRRSTELAAILSAENLLTGSNIVLNNGGAASKFYMIHQPTYRNLAPDIIERWFRDGWIDAISLILSSQTIWLQQLTARYGNHKKMAAVHG